MKLVFKPHEIYSFIVHFIFAIILTQSFTITSSILFFPDDPIYTNQDSFIQAIELLFVYVIIISGWVGYSRSMIKWPHTDKREGVMRFILDLGILFTYFMLISLIDENKLQNHIHELLIILYFLYLVWDIIKIKEYDKKVKLFTKTFASLIKTVFFLTLFIIYSIIFTGIMSWINLSWITFDTLYLIDIGILVFLILSYRKWKWQINAKSDSVESVLKKLNT